jgi:hypothetical protein
MAALPLLKPRCPVTTAVRASPVPQTSAVLLPDWHSLQVVPVPSRRAVGMQAVLIQAAATPAVRQTVAVVRNPPGAVRFSSTPPPEQ